jgi:hypothetical protein
MRIWSPNRRRRLGFTLRFGSYWRLNENIQFELGVATRDGRVSAAVAFRGCRALLLRTFSWCAHGVTTLSFRERMTRDAKNAFPAILVRDLACNGVPDDTF